MEILREIEVVAMVETNKHTAALKFVLQDEESINEFLARIKEWMLDQLPSK